MEDNTNETEKLEREKLRRKRIAQAINFEVMCARRAYSIQDPNYEWDGDWRG